MREEIRQSRSAGVIVGLIFGGMGTFIVLVAADIIRADPASFHAPRWVVAAAGLAFVLAGLSVATAPLNQGEDIPRRVTLRGLLLGGPIVALLAAVAHWVAFGPGERRFGGGFSIPFITISSRTPEWTGRLIFGIGAVMLDAMLLWILVRGIRDLRRAR